MFKELFEFVNEGRRGKGRRYAAGAPRRVRLLARKTAGVLPAGADDRAKVDAIVNDGLEYGRKPKGLVTFHAYPEGSRKAVEEHLAEGAAYAASGGGVRIHFTVSPEHMAGSSGFRSACPLYEQCFWSPLRSPSAEALDRHHRRESRQHPLPAGGRSPLTSCGARIENSND